MVPSNPPEPDIPTTHAARGGDWTVRELAGLYASGFAMGSADIVPGVSGGTIALVIGIYERLVGNLRQGAGATSRLLRGDPRGAWKAFRIVDWRFLVALLAGILTAVFVLSGLLSHLLESQPVAMSAFFFGLVTGSVFVAFDEVDEVDRRAVVTGVVVAVATFLLLGLRSGRFTDPSLLVLFVGGMLAVTAMILPGISGSFILLLLGLFEVVIGAVDDRDVVRLATVAAGAVVGLGAFSTFLNWLLRRHHDVVLAALIGLMAGSLRVLWPWPAGGVDGIGNTALGAPVVAEVPTAIGLALVGAGLVVAISLLGRRYVAQG